MICNIIFYNLRENYVDSRLLKRRVVLTILSNLDQSRQNLINFKYEQNKGATRILGKAKKEPRFNDQGQVRDQNNTKDIGHNKDFMVKNFYFNPSKLNFL